MGLVVASALDDDGIAAQVHYTTRPWSRQGLYLIWFPPSFFLFKKIIVFSHQELTCDPIVSWLLWCHLSYTSSWTAAIVDERGKKTVLLEAWVHSNCLVVGDTLRAQRATEEGAPGGQGERERHRRAARGRTYVCLSPPGIPSRRRSGEKQSHRASMWGDCTAQKPQGDGERTDGRRLICIARAPRPHESSAAASRSLLRGFGKLLQYTIHVCVARYGK
jgi:hypothetical protein